MTYLTDEYNIFIEMLTMQREYDVSMRLPLDKVDGIDFAESISFNVPTFTSLIVSK